MGYPVKVVGLRDAEHTLQGDRAVVSVLAQMKTPGDIVVDISEIPDLAPILAAAASVRTGTTVMVGGARLRYKESDRIASTVSELTKLGAEIYERPDGMVIVGKKALGTGTRVRCDSWNDHRIVMTTAIAAAVCLPGTEVVIDGAEAVGKSYPNFWRDYRALGGNAIEGETA